LPPAARWSPPTGTKLQVIAGRVLVDEQETRARSVLPDVDRVIATPDEVSCCLLAIRQPPLAR